MARYILIGGFLGAGKSTAIVRLARFLADRGERAGIVTNDQSLNLVDTAVVRAEGHPVEEIGDGCFCCRFDSLVAASRKLEHSFHPSVYIAEPVGCCTDLVATVSYPLHRHHGGDYALAPLSVMVDPVRARRFLGLEPGKAFSEDVEYIYRKQLEEAHVIVINKSDLLDQRSLAELEDGFRERFPAAVHFTVSARSGDGLEPWFEHLTRAPLPGGAAMELDYDRYARGESRLGWLNCAANVEAPGSFDGNLFLRDFADAVLRRLRDSMREVAHLKMTLSPGEASSSIALLNLVGNDREPELARRLEAPVLRGWFLLNLRAESAPELLQEIVLRAVDDSSGTMPGLRVSIAHLDSFQPARPQPTHRLVSLRASL